MFEHKLVQSALNKHIIKSEIKEEKPIVVSPINDKLTTIDNTITGALIPSKIKI